MAHSGNYQTGYSTDPRECVWLDPECECERSPDVPTSVPCPVHNEESD